MPVIDKLFAFITADSGPEDEGVIAFYEGGAWFPMVGADMKRIESLRPIAEQLAKDVGKPIRLVHFTNRVEVEVIEP